MAVSKYLVTDLGELIGDVLLFGGVYSNLQALEALRAEARARDIPTRNMVCTGDLAGYCADTAMVLEYMGEGSCGTFIAGNVEKQLATGAEDCGCGFAEDSQCDLASRRWFAEASRQITPEAAASLSQTPDIVVFAQSGRRYAVIHGGLKDISRFIWPSSPDAVFEEEFAAIEAEVGQVDGVIAGHCGIPFERDINGKAWINAGVIGMPPHDGRTQTRFAILSEDGVRFYSLDYDFEQAARRMEDVGLMQGYEKALRSGIWPSEDILPVELRRVTSFSAPGDVSPTPVP